MAETFGIIEAARRARAWGPHLTTAGQRVILAGLVFYTGADSQAHPSVWPKRLEDGSTEPGQLPAWSGFTSRACSRILTELMEMGAIVPVGENGSSPFGNRSKGGKPTRWTVQPCPGSQGSTLTGESGSESSTLTGEAQTLTGEAGNPDPAVSGVEMVEKTENGSSVAAAVLKDDGSSVAEDCEGHDEEADECRACMRRRFPKLPGEKLGDYVDRIAWLIEETIAGNLDPDVGMTDEDYEWEAARG